MIENYDWKAVLIEVFIPGFQLFKNQATAADSVFTDIHQEPSEWIRVTI
jgi:hypothetical protein